MSTRTLIECTDATWNVVTGCEKISAGCKNCYAERHWRRLSKNAATLYFNRSFDDVKAHADRLSLPLHWRKPRLVFVNSMSDLFHPDVPFTFIHRVWSKMMFAHQHFYQILTKRPENALAFFGGTRHYPSSRGFSRTADRSGWGSRLRVSRWLI
ncbi:MULTISPECIES: DUF5131 family protein [unclassified Thioalkalivibrio]|uniref:DUF5131 family protein n=1 Tax=unclassified Thioalkalivibrio TaxID=2621013 RepID=UPI0009DAEC26